MTRFHSTGDQRHMARRRRLARGLGLRPGNHRNRHPLDCGRAHCSLCHAKHDWAPPRRAVEKRDARRLLQEAGL